MALTVTLAQLRTQVRQRADMEDDGNFIADSELNTWINESISDLYDVLLESMGEDFYLSSTTLTGDGTTEAFTLPTDFYLLRGVDATQGDERIAIRPFHFRERNRVRNSTSLSRFERTRYRLEGSATATGYTGKIRLLPAPPSGQGYIVWYTPLPPALSDDAHVWDGFNRWHEYVVVDVAIKARTKEESDTTDLRVRKAELEARIRALSAVRDVSEPETVGDVTDDDDPAWVA